MFFRQTADAFLVLTEPASSMAKPADIQRTSEPQKRKDRLPSTKPSSESNPVLNPWCIMDWRKPAVSPHLQENSPRRLATNSSAAGDRLPKRYWASHCAVQKGRVGGRRPFRLRPNLPAALGTDAVEFCNSRCGSCPKLAVLRRYCNQKRLAVAVTTAARRCCSGSSYSRGLECGSTICFPATIANSQVCYRRRFA